MTSHEYDNYMKKLNLQNDLYFKEWEKRLENIGIPEKHLRSSFLSIDKLALKCGWISDWGHFTPSEIDDLLKEWSDVEISSEKQEQMISNYFIEYYSAYNFKNLEEHLTKWLENPIFKKRMSIFRDCIFALQNSSPQFNPSNLVVPVLISQIDGIFGELLKHEGWSYTEVETKKGKKIKKWVFKKDGEIVKSEIKSEKVFGNLIKDKRNYLGTFRPKYSISKLIQTNSRHEVIIEGLFQSTNYGDDIKNPSFISRHKIIHGEDIDYGTQKNAIKLFLILNYLSKFAVSKLADPDDHELVEFRTLQSVYDEEKNECNVKESQ